MTIWSMRIAYWVPKATDAHSEYVALIAFPLQQLSQERTSEINYTEETEANCGRDVELFNVTSGCM